MDIEKLIEQLKYYGTTYAIGDNLGKEIDGSDELMLDAATALSTLQAENKRLNKIVCAIPTTPDSERTISQYDKEMSMCAYLDDLEAENEKLRAELEQAHESLDFARTKDAEIMRLGADLARVTAERDDARATLDWFQQHGIKEEDWP